MLDEVVSAVIMSILPCKNALSWNQNNLFAFQFYFLVWEVAGTLCLPLLEEVSSAK